ncbi:MAG: hypothetical protein AAF098_07035 [Pseudomonadota bacterium]
MKIGTRYLGKTAPLRAERGVELALLLVLAVLAIQLGGVAWAYFRDARVGSVAPAADVLSVARSEQRRSITGSDSMQIKSRPLFWSSRRPEAPIPEVIVAEEGGSQKAAGRIKGLVVTGAVGAGDEGMAIVEFKGEQFRLRVGEELEGWTLLPIDGGRVVFASATQRDERVLTPLPISEAPSITDTESPGEDQATASASPPMPPGLEAKLEELRLQQEARKRAGVGTPNQRSTAPTERKNTLSLGG